MIPKTKDFNDTSCDNNDDEIIFLKCWQRKKNIASKYRHTPERKKNY